MRFIINKIGKKGSLDGTECNADEDYFALVYHRNVNDLFSWGKTFTQNEEIIKDCIQDIFAYLLENPHKQKEIQNIRTYLFTTFRNRLLKALQKKSLNGLNADFNETDFSNTKDTSKIIIEDIEIRESLISKKKMLRKVLKSLTMNQKKIIFLRYYKQMEYDEICEILSLNYQSARTLIYRAIQKMRETYKNMKLIDL